MTAHRVATASHTALLDVLSGVGLLALPRTPDLFFGSGEGMHGSDWHVMVQRLDTLGWEPLADDDGLPVAEGRTDDGRPVVALYGYQPVHEGLGLLDLQRARDELWPDLHQ